MSARRSWGQLVFPSLLSGFSVLIGLGVGLLFIAVLGEDPWQVLQVLVRSSFGTRYDFGMTLFYSTPLIFTGLSVAIAFKSGLFNIGAEGQLNIGALAMTLTGLWIGDFLPHSWGWLGTVLACAVGVVAGMLWGTIPGWLKAVRGSHEVINTIMLNFIAAAISSWVVLYVIKNSLSQAPESAPLAEGLRISLWQGFEGAPVSGALILGVVSSVCVYLFFDRTRMGFEMKAVGENFLAAQVSGISAGRMQILAMALAGGVAALVGFGEILGSAGKFKLEFSPGYGFQGIAVALLARNHPLGVLASALLFGALHKGSLDLDLETERVTRDFALIFQALVILSVAAFSGFSWVKFKKGKKGRAR